MAQIFNKTDGERIPASGRRAPNIFSKTENLFFFIFHPSYIMNQVLNQKMTVNEIQEKCPNLLKTAKNQTIYHIEECCWGTEWQNKFKEGFRFHKDGNWPHPCWRLTLDIRYVGDNIEMLVKHLAVLSPTSPIFYHLIKILSRTS